MGSNEGTILELSRPLGWKDTGVRAIKTFIQVFVGGLIVPPVTEGVTLLPHVSLDVLQTLVLSAGAAAISVILNKILEWSSSR